jgi:hypothetical protein
MGKEDIETIKPYYMLKQQDDKKASMDSISKTYSKYDRLQLDISTTAIYTSFPSKFYSFFVVSSYFREF